MLQNFKVYCDNAYQEIFTSSLVSKQIANFRFEKNLSFGEKVQRVRLDLSGVSMNPTVIGADSVVSTVNDSSEYLTVNLNNEVLVHLSDAENSKAGNMKAAETLGAELGKISQTDLDRKFFSEVLNAGNTFDSGDLTSMVSNNIGIQVNATTTPQLLMRAPAKLSSKAKQSPSNIIFVADSYTIGDMAQYVLTKDLNVSESVLKNGYAGLTTQAKLFVSDNLTATSILTASGNMTQGSVITIRGISFLSAATPVSQGSYKIGSTINESLTNLANVINNPKVTSATQIAITDADKLAQMKNELWSAEVNGNTLIVKTCAGRAVVSTDQPNAAWTQNIVNCYFGKINAIDMVLQSDGVQFKDTDSKRGTNIFSSYLGGIKTFSDGAQKFLNVKIAA